VAQVRLLKPTLEMLPSYEAALRRGWSPDNVRGLAAAQEQLRTIEADPQAFVAGREDREGKGPPIRMPDGTERPRLPGYFRWLWDGEFAGSLGFRWRPGTSDLPPWVYGHIGYAVPPWKRGRGYATRALSLILPQARAEGLTQVFLTTDVDNYASQKTILANGGELVGTFVVEGDEHAGEKLRYRITL
jgi:predicted acetyltransferase